MITLDNLSYRYHGGHLALDNLTSEIGPGLHLLIGENGSGKTTLMHIIAGLRKAVPEHSCLIDGTPTALRLPETLSKVFILTDNIQFPYSTIRKMAEYHAVFYPTFSEELLNSYLERFGMTGDEQIDRFSLGNRKKAQLAYALALQTDILLLDEPLNGLDITARNEFIQMLAESNDGNRTMIISSHTVLDFRNLIDSVIVLSGSHLVLSMPLWQISEKVSFVSELEPVSGAIFMQPMFGHFNAIIPNDGTMTTDVDLILFYGALQSKAKNTLLSYLRPTTE